MKKVNVCMYIFIIHACLKCKTCRWLRAALSTASSIPLGYKKVTRAVADDGEEVEDCGDDDLLGREAV
jgi:hypothetical protein